MIQPQSGQPLWKPERGTKAREKRKARRTRSATGKVVREYVFARERNLCRVTRFLPAVSMHELRPRSLGGRVSRRNSVAVHGDGVNGIHGLLQRHEITYVFETPELGAEGTVIFTAQTSAAAELMKVRLGESIASRPMVQVEAEV